MMAPLTSIPLPGRISLGCATFGREIDGGAANRIMDHAVSRGISLFDTAASYGAGRSEEIIGAWLASRAPASFRPTLATKVLPPYTARAIADAVAASAGRLGVSTIDLLFLHTWDDMADDPFVLAMLDELVRSRRVRALGVSNFSAAQLERFVARQKQAKCAPIRFIQNNNNVAVRGVDDRLRSLCAEHAVKIITYSPLGAGFLTGKHDRGVVPGSRFSVAPGHQNIYFNEAAQRRLNRLHAAAARSGHRPASLALAWALHQPGVASVLIGARELAHLDQAFDALALDDPALLNELSEAP